MRFVLIVIGCLFAQNAHAQTQSASQLALDIIDRVNALSHAVDGLNAKVAAQGKENEALKKENETLKKSNETPEKKP